MLILFIDDDTDDQEIFCNVIKSINSKVVCHIANNGQEALELLDELVALPNYIFLDLNMPKMGGKEFLRNLRKSPLFKDLKVVIYSTTKRPSEVVECMELGAIDFLIKPTEVRDIFTVMQRFLV